MSDQKLPRITVEEDAALGLIKSALVAKLRDTVVLGVFPVVRDGAIVWQANASVTVFRIGVLWSEEKLSVERVADDPWTAAALVADALQTEEKQWRAG